MPTHERIGKMMILVLGAGLVLASGCRLERLNQDRSAAHTAAPSPSIAAVVPEALLVAPAAAAAALSSVRAVLCKALRPEADPPTELARALEQLECAVRAQGRGQTDALFLSSGGRWGSGSLIPSDHLATRAAFDGFVHSAGVRYGAGPMQPLAACALGGEPAAPSAPDSAETASDLSHASQTAAVIDPDADAGVEPATMTTTGSDISPMQSSPHQLIAVLLRDAHGRFHGALALSLASDALQQSAGIERSGLEVLPGQRMHAGDAGIVLVDPQWPRDYFRAPAPAAEAYQSLVVGSPKVDALAALWPGGSSVGLALGISVERITPSTCAGSDQAVVP